MQAIGSAVAVIGDSDRVLERWRPEAVPLQPFEVSRAEALRRSRDRRDYLAAHVLARVAASLASGEHWTDIVVRQLCSSCGGPHGRPTVVGHPDLSVSWSHSGGSTAAIVGSCPVSIDIESNHGAGPNFPVRQVRDWVRFECLVKLGLTTLDRWREYQDALSTTRRTGRPSRMLEIEGLADFRVVDWISGDSKLVASAMCHRSAWRGWSNLDDLAGRPEPLDATSARGSLDDGCRAPSSLGR